MREFNVIDTTLRDGETAGVNFSLEEKLKIVKKLYETGVRHIEIGIPAMGKWEINQIKEIIKQNLDIEYTTWNRLKQDDLEYSIDCGIKNVHISVPVSDLHIERKLGKNRKWVLNEIERIISYAKNRNCNVYLGAEDASRADMNFLVKIFNNVKEMGVRRVRFADTMSTLTPFTTMEKITQIKEETNLAIDFHGHNDFGMATANALAAFKAGADYISTSVNGIGERAGNVALEEIITALKYFENCKIEIDLKKFLELSRIVEKASGIKLARNKPIIGTGVFTHESGIHVDGIIKSKDTYEFLKPEDFGRENEITLGKHSGKGAIIKALAEKGVEYNNQKITHLLEKVREISYIDKRADLNKVIGI